MNFIGWGQNQSSYKRKLHTDRDSLGDPPFSISVLVKCKDCSPIFGLLFHPVKKIILINNHSVKLVELIDKVGQL